jgi:hypothetical protein
VEGRNWWVEWTCTGCWSLSSSRLRSLLDRSREGSQRVWFEEHPWGNPLWVVGRTRSWEAVGGIPCKEGERVQRFPCNQQVPTGWPIELVGVDGTTSRKRVERGRRHTVE